MAVEDADVTERERSCRVAEAGPRLHTTHRGISSSVPGGTQGLEGGPGSPIASEGSRTLGPAAVGAAPGLVRDVELVC